MDYKKSSATKCFRVSNKAISRTEAPFDSRLQARSLREARIRSAAKEAVSLARKEIPKEVREKRVSTAKSKALIEQVEAILGYDNGVELEMFGMETMSSLKKTSSQLSSILEVIENKIEELVSAFKKAMSSVLWKIPFLILLWCVADRFGLGLGCLGVLAPAIVDRIGPFWDRYVLKKGAQLESGGEDITSMIATMLVSCIVPKSANASTYADILLRRVATFQRSRDGFKVVFSELLTWFEKLLNVASSFFGGREFILTDRTYGAIKAWMAKVDAFETVCTLRNPTTQELRAAVDLSVEGIGFKRVAATPATQAMLGKYTERLGLLLQSRRGALNAADAFRAQPVFVLLGGGSGVGKTILQQYVAVAALIRSGYITDGESGIENLWQKGLSEYWNGYVQQKCLILDDVFQVKSPDNMADSEFMQVIRLIGNWACPLNYADIESKGRFYFNSPLVMGSTNQQDIASAAKELVVFPEAVTRRIQFGYWLDISEEYRAPHGGFDYTKWQRKFCENIMTKDEDTPYLDCIPWEAWRLYRHSFDKAFQPPSPFEPYTDIRTLIDEVADTLRQRREMHDDATELSRNFFRGLAMDVAMARERDSSTPDLLESGVASIPPSEGGSVFEDAGSTTFCGTPRMDIEDVLHALQCGEGFMSDDFHWEVDSRGRDTRDLRDFIFLESDLPCGENCWGVESHQVPFDESDLEEDIQVLEIERSGWREFGAGLFRTMFDWCKAVSTCVVGIVSPVWCDFSATVGRSALSIIDQYFTNPCSRTRVQFALLVGGLACVVTGVLAFAWSVMRATVSWISDMFEATLAFFGLTNQIESNIKEKGRPRDDGPKLTRTPGLQSGGGNDNAVHKLVLNNCYLMSCLVADEWRPVGTVQFVCGTIAMIPAHFIDDLSRLDLKTVLRFTCVAQGQFKLDLPVEVFLGFRRVSFVESKIDVAFVKFSMATLRAHRDVTKQFLTEDNVRAFLRAGSQPVTMFTLRDQSPPKSDPYVYRVDYVSDHCKYVESMHINGVEYRQSLEIVARSERGDCGSPVMISDPKFFGGRCYLGMHHAGRKGVLKPLALSHIVTQEMVKEAVKTLDTYKDDFAADLARRDVELIEPSNEEVEALLETGVVGGSMILLGKVNKGVCTSTTSKIRRSPMGIDEPLGPSGKAPARQSPYFKDGKMVYPMANAMSAYQSPLEFRRPPRLRLAAETVMQPFFKASRHCPRTILTFEEAVVPPIGWTLKPIPRDTSPGYPYKLKYAVGKTAFFGKEGDYTFTGEACAQLRKDVAYIVEKAKANERTCVISNDFLKDEVRPQAKVDAGMTRAISAVALDYSIAVRMYFGAFLNAFLYTNLEANFAPGMNPITDWEIMVDKLLSKGNNTFAGDFKRFDASEQPYIHMVILDIINAWYAATGERSEEDERVRNILWLDLIHSRHLTGLNNTQSMLVQWNKSLPSGHPLTTVVNSMYCAICLATCYVNLTGDVTDMHKHVMLIPFGDDNINSVSDTMREVFNQRTVAGAMDELLGLTYTSDKKDAELVDFEPLEDLVFLQRTTRIAPGEGILCPLLDGSMLFAPYWHKNNKAVREDMLDNVQTTLGELSLHPREKWDEVVRKLYPWLIERDMFSDLRLTSYEACREWRMSHVDKWV